MKFSIVIPIYNVEKYLTRCIESVISQTYREREIILIDDGSKDRSGNICDEYAACFPSEVKVIHTENQGQLMARSYGIDHSEGDVLLFMDADDYIRSDTLELLNCQFESTSADLVLFNASQDENFATPYPGFGFKDGQQFAGDAKKNLLEMLITTSKLNPLWVKALKRELAYSICDEYRHFQLKNAGDLLYTLPIISSAQNIVYMDQNLYYWRAREESIVHTYNPERHRALRKVHLEMEKYLDVWGMEEYHPIHYAREVRGWIECLKMALANMAKPDIQLMKELSEDTYFLKAYSGMDRSVLAMSDVVLAKWLYQKKYGCILLAGKALHWTRAVKRLVKGNREHD